jgi:hypothetical protein
MLLDNIFKPFVFIGLGVTLQGEFMGDLKLTEIGQNYWSALATAPAETSAQAKEASNSTEFCFVVFLSPTIELPLLGNLGS